MIWALVALAGLGIALAVAAYRAGSSTAAARGEAAAAHEDAQEAVHAADQVIGHVHARDDAQARAAAARAKLDRIRGNPGALLAFHDELLSRRAAADPCGAPAAAPPSDVPQA